MSAPTVLIEAGIVIGAITGISGVVLTFRSQARARAREDDEERQKIRDAAYEAGRQSQTYRITQLSAQLEDVRADLKQARRELSMWEQRYLNLRDRGHET